MYISCLYMILLNVFLEPPLCRTWLWRKVLVCIACTFGNRKLFRIHKLFMERQMRQRPSLYWYKWDRCKYTQQTDFSWLDTVWNNRKSSDFCSDSLSRTTALFTMSTSTTRRIVVFWEVEFRNSYQKEGSTLHMQYICYVVVDTSIKIQRGNSIVFPVNFLHLRSTHFVGVLS